MQNWWQEMKEDGLTHIRTSRWQLGREEEENGCENHVGNTDLDHVSITNEHDLPVNSPGSQSIPQHLVA